jgi:ubiquinone/menaquinone biosynthesis C-methylase UbiE
MNRGNKYAGSIPDTYHNYLVPLIFDAYALDLARRAAIEDTAAVLETAAGTGVLSEYLANILPPSVRIVATDLNPAMLAVAEQQFSGQSNITFEVASGTDLPFDSGSFDTVLCQFGIMFFPDIDLGYREARRVLKPGGRLIFNVWDVLAENGFSRAVHEAALSLDPENPPGFLSSPYAYSDVAMITQQLEHAGFSDVTAEVLRDESHAASVRDVSLALAAGSPLALQLEERGLEATAVDDIEALLLKEFGPGPVSAPMQAIIFTATA